MSSAQPRAAGQAWEWAGREEAALSVRGKCECALLGLCAAEEKGKEDEDGSEEAGKAEAQSENAFV